MILSMILFLPGILDVLWTGLRRFLDASWTAALLRAGPERHKHRGLSNCARGGICGMRGTQAAARGVDGPLTAVGPMAHQDCNDFGRRHPTWPSPRARNQNR